MKKHGKSMTIDNRPEKLISRIDRFEAPITHTLPEMGEGKFEILKNRPEVRLKKWNSEVNLGVKYDKIKKTGEQKQGENKIEYKDIKEELHVYPLEPFQGGEDGGLEIEILLKEKPDTNKFDFNIEGAENLDFFYQSELTQDEIDDGNSRPKNVIGSYAVYHKTKVNHSKGVMNYATGKAFHIYRPKAIDTNGKEEWGILSYENGVLSVTVPQSFLDSAVYPVKVDPTFGYTTIGGTASALNTDQIKAIRGPVTANGTVDSVSVYGNNLSDGDNSIQGAVYDSSENLLTPQTATGTINSSTDQWWTLNFTGGPSVSNGSDYYATIFWDASVANTVRRYRDTVASGPEQKLKAATYNTWPDPLAGTNSTLRDSVYATYTVSSASAPYHTLSFMGV